MALLPACGGKLRQELADPLAFLFFLYSSTPHIHKGTPSPEQGSRGVRWICGSARLLSLATPMFPNTDPAHLVCVRSHSTCLCFSGKSIYYKLGPIYFPSI